MPSVIRQNDVNQVGGAAISNLSSTVFCNGLPVARIGSLLAPHGCCGAPGCAAHCSASITTGNETVLVEGIPIAIVGSMNTCGHSMAIGSGDVNA